MEAAELVQALKHFHVDQGEALEIPFARVASPQVTHPEAYEILAQSKPE
jgi:hypothetical protein